MNTKVIVSIVILIIAGIIIFFLRPSPPPARPKDAYYFNLDTKKVFVSAADQFSPIETDDGKSNGVRIYIFSANKDAADFNGLTLDEVKAKGGVPGWLESYPPEARAKLVAGTMDAGDAVSSQLIRAVDGGNWYPAMSSIASRIRDQARSAASSDAGPLVLVNP